MKQGDERAAQRLWQRYSPRVVGLARRQLSAAPRRSADEEDVAQTAFVSFWRDAREGRYPDIRDREDLWQLLRVITKRKVLDHIKHECRKKRGGGAVRGESAVSSSTDGQSGLDQFEGRSDSPEDTAAAREAWDQLLARLDDAELRKIAALKRAGYTNEEIAERFQCSQSTVFRRLATIRRAWLADNPEHEAA
jgi:RNA polymerase sigma factor (sigma-70 family)